MSLTRKALRDMGLTAEQVDGVIAAHLTVVEAVKASAAQEMAERQTEAEAFRTQARTAEEAARQEAQTVQAAFDAYRAEAERREKQSLLRKALEAAGANPAAAPLLAQHADLDALTLDNGALLGAEEAVSRLKDGWAPLFTVETVQPLPSLSPMTSAAAPLSREDVASMTLEDINRHWHTVSALLREQR